MDPEILTWIVGLLCLFIAGLAAYLWWQSRVPAAPFDEMFAVRESEVVRIQRQASGWTILPADGNRPLALRSGLAPDNMSSLVPVTCSPVGCQALQATQPTQRYFFEVHLADGQRVETAERRLPLPGAANFRDFGGYPTLDGRRVAWGQVYRADELHNLGAMDWAWLENLGLRLVVDLRTYREVRQRPDHLPPDLAYTHLPVFAEDPIGWLRVLFLRQRLDTLFKQLYTRSILDQGAALLGRVLRLAAEPSNLPMVLHCTAGKDRTGMAAALLLHICGVRRATIVADYSLTNLAVESLLDNIRIAIGANHPPPGLHIEQVYPLLSARPALIEHAFDHIEARYGSLDRYLLGPAGLEADDLKAIRRNLVV